MVRASLQMAQSSGAAKFRVAIRMSDDGVTFAPPVPVGPLVRTSDGASYGSDYTNLSTTFSSKRYFQIGVECTNSTGTSLEFCSASLQLDFE